MLQNQYPSLKSHVAVDHLERHHSKTALLPMSLWHGAVNKWITTAEGEGNVLEHIWVCMWCITSDMTVNTQRDPDV